MAVPARRTSKAKKAKRRTHYKLTINGLNECANCGEMKKPPCMLKLWSLRWKRCSNKRSIILLQKRDFKILRLTMEP